MLKRSYVNRAGYGAGARRLRRILAAIVQGGVLILSPSIATAQDPLTTRQMEALSPRVANQTVQRDLLSLLEPVNEIRSGMFRRLHGVTLMTRPFGTEFEGVCRQDIATLWYAPADSKGNNKDTPIRPFSIEAYPAFHISELPKNKLPYRDAVEFMQQTECDRVARRENVNWFSAKNAFEAVQGAYTMKMAIDQIKGGTLKARPCPSVFPGNFSCEKVITDVGELNKIDSIQACVAPPGSICYSIDLAGSTKLTIIAEGSTDAPAPAKINSIEVEQYMVVT
jgi:hypothetical protein